MMENLRLSLLLGALILPLAGLSWLVLAQHVLRIDTRQKAFAGIIAGLATICVLGLLLLGEQSVPLPEWIPGAGPMSLHLGGRGGQIAAITAAMLFISLLFGSKEKNATAFGVLLAALAAANAAFLAGHFLFRYLTLEAVGLCIGLIPLVATSAAHRRRHNSLRQATETYLLLRLGDVGLLGAILILWHTGGTLDIDPAIAYGQGLSPTAATWTVSGLLLAVWVKAGLWPFHRWQGTGSDLPPATGSWLYGLVMPNLGLYLLYRTAPLLSTAPSALIWSAVIAAILGFVFIVREMLPRRLANDEAYQRWPALGGSLISTLGVLLAIAGRPSYLPALMLVTTPIRTAAWLVCAKLGKQPASQRQAERATSHAIPAGAGRSRPQSVEGYIMAVARWLSHWVETRIAHEGVLRLWHLLVGTARAWHHAGEERAMTTLVDGTAKGAVSVSRWLQRLHTGKLRVKLQWTMAALIVMISYLILSGW
jgi:hypothetical protein